MGQKKKMTRGTRRMVEAAISQLDPSEQSNTNAICFKMTDMLIEKFEGGNLDYQLERMDLQKTQSILDKIEEYFQKYPTSVSEKIEHNSSQAE